MIIPLRILRRFICAIVRSMSLIVSITTKYACFTGVNIDRHQAAGASVAASYNGGGSTMVDLIEAERSDGEQMGDVDQLRLI